MFETPFKTVIVGVDFSPFSKNVVKQAQLLCDLYDAKMVLVHAVTDYVDYGPAPYPLAIFPNIISTDEYITRMKSFYHIKDFTTKMYAEYGSPASVLNRVAKKFRSPLIMVGHRGHSALAHFFLGSTAQSLALKSHYPVWIHRGKVRRPERVLVPHDLTKPSSRSIKLLKKMTLATPMSYEVFYVDQRPFPILDYKTYQKMTRRHLRKTRTAIHHLLKDFPHTPFVTAEGDVTTKIAKRSSNFDVVLLTHHHKPGLFTRTETEKILRKSPVPILVTH